MVNSLTCPIVAFAGTEDEIVSVEEVAAWGEYTRAPFRLCVLPGGHFAFYAAQDFVLAAIVHNLDLAHAG